MQSLSQSLLVQQFKWNKLWLTAGCLVAGTLVAAVSVPKCGATPLLVAVMGI